MTSLADLQETGTKLGLSGEELLDFIKDQQNRERDERAYARDEKEKARVAEEKARAAELEKSKLEAEEKEKDRVANLELEKSKLEAEENAKELERRKMEIDREIYLARIESERKERDRQRDLEAQLKREEWEYEKHCRDEEMALEREKLAEQAIRHETELKTKERIKNMAKDPKLPYFEDSKDKMDSYLSRFEKYAEANGWLKEKWALNLSALLKGRALEVYDRLSTDDAGDYDKLKEALLKNFEMTEVGFRKRFKEGRPEKSETFVQFVSRIGNYLEKWLSLGNVEKTYQGLKDFIIRDQLLECSGRELYQYLRPKKCESAQKMAEEADLFAESRGGVNRVVKQSRVEHSSDKKVQSNTRVEVVNKSNSKFKPPINKCGNCGGNHWTSRCWKSVAAVAVEKSGCDTDTGRSYQSTSAGASNYSRSDRGRGVGRGRGRGRADRQNTTETHQVSFCKVQPSEKENFSIGGMPEQVVQKNQVDSIGTDSKPSVCYFLKSRLPTAPGKVNGKDVIVLRDTGCTGVVVRKDLVESDQILDRQSKITLIDDTTQSHAMATIAVDCPFFKGIVDAICIDNPLYDLVIGNVDGSKLPDMSHFSVSAAVTRSKSRDNARSSSTSKLVVPEQIAGVTKQEFRESQESDPNLESIRKLAKSGEVRKVKGKKQARVKFVYKKNLLYREYEYSQTTCRQLVVPTKFRTAVMKLAHESVMAGHLGTRKSTDRVLSEFYWNGVCGDISRFVRSCDVCQRTIPKGKVGKVPLGKMPLIDTPFRRVSVDIVGPILPRSTSGKRYILTMIDFATRYPEAVALSNIEAETVAEALVGMFSRVGVPDEMLSDCGTQFTSDVMNEVSRLLSLQQITTAPWNPKANGLCEKFNGTLKNMIRKMCAEKPKDWDRYLPALLFAVREVPQESLGFSPFELLYGRSVRGPMSILKELWSGEVPDENVKTSYQYVVDLNDRLESTCKLASENLKLARKKQKQYYDRKARDRRFKVGDKVLLLLPSSRNKLLVQWRGPFVVTEVIGRQDYRIRVENVERVFHANLLKLYVERKSVSCFETATCVEQFDCDVDPDADETIDKFELVSVKATQTYEDVNVSETLSNTQQKEARQLLKKFSDVLSDVPGRTDIIKHDIKLTSAEPIRTKNYPIPLKLQDAVDCEVKSMLEMGVIEYSNSPYSSPMVIVKKPDASIRLCIDFRKLNKVTIFDAEPMPNMERVFNKMAGYKYFSKFDLTKGYYQVPLTDEAKQFTAFETSLGLMQFTVTPFGLVNSGASFCRMMRMVLNGMRNTESFVDDVWIYTNTWEEHMMEVEEFLSRIRNAGLTAKPNKCVIGASKVECLGHFISQKGLHPNEEKIKAIVQLERPQTKKQVRSWLGMTGFYRRHIPNYSIIAAPLTELTKNRQPNKHIQWTDAEEKAFRTLKDRLTNYPVLRLPEANKTFILQTDASDKGLGAILSQEFEDGKFPIAYASRKLLDRERNYSVIEKECLAIVWGIEKFHIYLYGAKFILETDHAPLTYLHSAKTLNPRIMRWALRLQPYHFRLRAVKGRENMGPDCLSRDEPAVLPSA